MCSRKGSAPPPREHTIREELQQLYDRRSAVETLIRSLEHYDSFRVPGKPGPGKSDATPSLR